MTILRSKRACVHRSAGPARNQRVIEATIACLESGTAGAGLQAKTDWHDDGAAGGNPNEVEGVLNPAAIRARDGNFISFRVSWLAAIFLASGLLVCCSTVLAIRRASNVWAWLWSGGRLRTVRERRGCEDRASLLSSRCALRDDVHGAFAPRSANRNRHLR